MRVPPDDTIVMYGVCFRYSHFFAWCDSFHLGFYLLQISWSNITWKVLTGDMDMQSEWHVETAALSDGIVVMVACHYSDDCACLAETYKVKLNESVATRVKLNSTGDTPDAQTSGRHFCSV